MKAAILICTVAAALCVAWAAPGAGTDTAQQLLALERQAMDGWTKGDPGPSLAILDPDVTYFHDVAEGRLDLAAVKVLFESYRGRPLVDRYEILDPKAQTSGNVAVLTYEFVTYNGSLTRRWHATEVFRRGKQGWRVIHSHWSEAKGKTQQASK